MSSIDDRGRRAGADLVRSANRISGPPLTELAARQPARARRVAAVGLVVALVAGGAWTMSRSDDGTQAVEVRGTVDDAAATTAEGPRPDRDADAADDGAVTGAPGGGSVPAPSANDPADGTPSEGGPPPPRGGSSSANAPTRSSAPPSTSSPTPSPRPNDEPPATIAPTPGPSEPPPVSTPNPGPTPPTVPPPTVTPTVGPPSGPLTPSSPAWASTCATADRLLAAAWAVDAGTSDDIVGVALLFIEMVGKVPPGVAVAEVAYTADLIAAMERRSGVAQFANDFNDNADTLLLAIGDGCGTPGGLPLPSNTLPQFYTLVFELGLF